MSFLTSDPSCIKWFEHNSSLALEYVACGLVVFPCWPDKRPASKWGDEHKRYATTPDQVRKLWWGSGEFLVGLRLDLSGLLIVDADRHHAGQDGVSGLRDLLRSNGFRRDEAPVILTPGGGVHLYFANPKGLRSVPQGAADLPAGVEVKGAGGMAIAPGTRLPDGRKYQRVNACFLMDAPPLPEWLEALAYPPRPECTWLETAKDVKDLEAVNRAIWKGEYENVARAMNGGRDCQLNKSAFKIGVKLVGPGHVSWRDALEHLTAAASASGLVKENGRRAVENTIKSGLKAGSARAG
jgi:hypothetical protein